MLDSNLIVSKYYNMELGQALTKRFMIEKSMSKKLPFLALIERQNKGINLNNVLDRIQADIILTNSINQN